MVRVLLIRSSTYWGKTMRETVIECLRLLANIPEPIKNDVLWHLNQILSGTQGTASKQSPKTPDQGLSLLSAMHKV